MRLRICLQARHGIRKEVLSEESVIYLDESNSHGEVLELLEKELGYPLAHSGESTRYGLATGLKRRGTPIERIPASERTREQLPNRTRRSIIGHEHHPILIC
jgi:hypothetical protein